MSGAQYDSWADYYDLAYDLTDPQADVEFYLGLLRQRENPTVLEMGCGSGRVLKKLAEAGITCTGVDISARMLEKAYERLSCLAQDQRVLAQLVHADMTSVDLQTEYDLVIYPFSAIVEAGDETAVLKAIQKGFRHLSNGGTLIIDNAYYGPEGIYREDYVMRYRKTIEHPRGSGRMISFFETDSWNRNDNITIRYLFADHFVQGQGQVQRQYFEIKRIYVAPDKMSEMLKSVDFNSVKLYGGFDFQDFEQCTKNKRQIWICVK